MEHFTGATLILLFAIAVLFILQGALIFVVWKTNKRISRFFNGKNGKSIEKVLEFEMRRMKKSEDDIRRLTDNMKWIEGISRKSVHKVGVVRFNPFKGSIGGDQSFSIAFLDFNDNGLIVSSLHAAEGTRIYAKPIAKRKSKYQLTKEEEKALEKATA